MLKRAQLAALRAKPQQFQESLKRTTRWLNNYFESESTEVQQFRQTLKELAIQPVSLKLPDELLSRHFITEALSQPTLSQPDTNTEEAPL